MDSTRIDRLNDAIKACTIDNKIDREKMMNMLKDEDFNDANYPNDPRSNNKQLINPDCILIVINLPKVEQERLAKLEAFIFKKVFDQQTFTKPISIDFPMDPDTSLSKGIMFLYLSSSNEVAKYKDKLNDLRLDKTHRLKVFTYKEYTITRDMPDKYESIPCEKPSIPPSEYNHWLADDSTCEQFCAVPVYNKRVEKIILNKVETYYDEFQPISISLNVPAKRVIWSPFGTFLILVSDGGVCIGILTRENKFALTRAIKIPDVSFVFFSPNEKFMVLYVDKLTRDNVIVVDVACGGVHWRGAANFDPSTHQLSLHWTNDCKYMIVGKSQSYKIYVVDDDFKPHPKSPLNIPQLKSVSVSPKSNCVAYWVATDNNQTGIATLYDIDNDHSHTLRRIVNPEYCEFYFQDNSKYLCISHKRLIKKKPFYNVDIVFLKEKDLPVLSLELSSAPVSGVYWEPNGDTFIVCLSDAYQIYRIVDNQIKLIASFSIQIQCKPLWSPNGRIVIMNFMQNKTTTNEIKIHDTLDGSILQSRHFRSVDLIKWDSSGRFFATCTTINSSIRDLCYTIWTMTGNFVRSHSIDNMSDFLWRPRPPCMLSNAEVNAIIKNLKKYSNDFDKLERDRSKIFFEKKNKNYVAKIVNYYGIILDHLDYIHSYYNYVSSSFS